MVDEPDPSSADPFAVVPDGESGFTYFRIMDPVTPDASIKGVIRQRFVDGHPSAQIFTRSQGWKRTVMTVDHRLGLLDDDLVEITPAVARDLIAQLQAAWRSRR